MNPWKIIGWIVLALLLLMIYSCVKVAANIGGSDTSAVPSSTSNAQPTYSVTVVSTECREDYGKNEADITVRNTGPTTIPFAKAFVEFRDGADGAGNVLSAQDSYFSPHDIPPGATASASVYSSGGGAKSCGMTAMQDGSGNAVSVQ